VTPPTRPLVEFHDVTVAYGRRPVVWNVDLLIDEPCLFGIRARDSHRLLNRGQRFIRTGMELVMPLIEDRLAAWNEGFEPA
jgi:hypothetical protein